MTQTLEDLAILRISEVKRVTGLCRSSIYQMMKDGIFPQSISLGHRAVGWMTCDIRNWLEAKRNGGTYEQPAGA
ncbi:MAG: AlpA family transcriptional regulator [Desulfobulbaceae bacterium]|nr:AlpA family transcriptional regulator [Desulfobulbaceae bacterium]